MSVSFIRIDDRMIHGQTCTRWAREYPCDGLIAVNDKAAKSDVLKAAYKAASGKKTFVWTVEDFKKKAQKVLDSDTRYFLITKECFYSRTIIFILWKRFLNFFDEIPVFTGLFIKSQNFGFVYEVH